MALETELQYFNSHRSEWVKEHEGKFVAIQHESLLSFFGKWEEALIAAYKAFGLSHPFLIKEVREKDRVVFIGGVGAVVN